MLLKEATGIHGREGVDLGRAIKDHESNEPELCEEGHVAHRVT